MDRDFLSVLSVLIPYFPIFREGIKNGFIRDCEHILPFRGFFSSVIRKRIALKLRFTSVSPSSLFLFLSESVLLIQELRAILDPIYKSIDAGCQTYEKIYYINFLYK